MGSKLKLPIDRLYDDLVAQRIHEEARLANDLMKEYPDLTRSEALRIAYRMYNKIPLLYGYPI
jgi:hypothetical protein